MAAARGAHSATCEPVNDDPAGGKPVSSKQCCPFGNGKRSELPTLSSPTCPPLAAPLIPSCQGCYFYSALASFCSRTAYANRGGDYNVSFANSSIRSLDQLPLLPGR